MIKQITQLNRGIFYDQSGLIMKCNPLATSLFTEFREQCCNYCLKTTQTNRCSNCKQYYYCSKECQIKDWKEHKQECKVLPQRNIPCNLLLLIRIYTNQINLSEFQGNIDTDCNEKEYQEMQECAAYIIHQLKTNDLKQLMEIQIKIKINSFTILDNSGNSIGIGIYQPANFFNHKCLRSSKYQNNVANCSHFFNNKELIIKTNNSYNNSIGLQEMTISYADIPNYNERQKFLKTNYNFNCECDRCKEEINSNQIKQPLSDNVQTYLQSLTNKQYKKALKQLEEIIELIPEYYDDNQHPFLGWRLNEASKLCFHLNLLLKAEDYSKKAITILEPFYQQNEEFKQLIERLKDIQAEIKMNK